MLKRFSILSFRYAYEGFVAALKAEPNLKFHMLAGLIVTLSAFYFKVSKTDWIFLIILIGFVIAIELTNTSIESTVDAFIDKQHPGAKLAKDISAGAVLVAAVTAAILGIIIFLPYIFNV